MKKKFLMFVMCFAVLGTALAGCGASGSTTDEVVVNTDDERVSDSDKTSDEADDKDADEDAADVTAPAVTEDGGDTDEEEKIPRSDAYEMFLAGDMNVRVIPDMSDEYYEYDYPTAGEYSYSELKDYVLEYFPGTFDIKYSIFTPASGQEGEDVLALCFENEDPSFSSWLGLMAYNDGELQLKYCVNYGYRSYFDIYYTGDILYGGSGGAGAQYQDYMQVMPDSSVVTVYNAAFLYSSWCDEISYSLDPDMEYEDRPSLNDESGLQVTRVNKDGKVYISAESYSDNKSIKADEEAFLNELVELGAILKDSDFVQAQMENSIDENAVMNWFDIETAEGKSEF